MVASPAAGTGRARLRARGAETGPARPLTRPPERNGTRASQADLTARIVSTAARWIYQGRRLDMQGLADELGVSRVTLFRRVGGRAGTRRPVPAPAPEPVLEGVVLDAAAARKAARDEALRAHPDMAWLRAFSGPGR